MKTKFFNIIDLSDDFKSFIEAFEGQHFNISIEAKKFNHNFDYLKNTLTLDFLIDLFPEALKPIKGEIYSVSFDFVKDKLNECFSYYSINGSVNISNDKNFITTRTNSFLFFIQNYFTFPAEKIYVHNPTYKSYFQFGIMWDFCFIFLNKDNGLVIAASAFD